MRVVAAVLAAGKGLRFGQDKTALLLNGKPVWRWSFDAFANHPDVDAVGLVGSSENIETLRGQTSSAAFVVEGGKTRQQSARIASEAADGEIVLIHDAARPFVSEELITRVIDACQRTGAAAPAVPVADTLRTPAGELVDRNTVRAMQTPQGARRDLLLAAHSKAGEDFTDEMALLRHIAADFEIVEGDPRNFKITTTFDFERARGMVGGAETRTGIGYDIHAFSTDPSRVLMLGGVPFEGFPALDGHSDADVVIHAAVDAIFGAAGLGDIGQQFPNTDPRWKDEPSITFLKHAAKEIRSRGWVLVNLDISMIGEKPKVMVRAAEIRETLARALSIDPSRIGFKATTNEGLGAIGRSEGIAAFAVATIREGF